MPKQVLILFSRLCGAHLRFTAVRKPNLERAVICRVKEEIGEVYVSERCVLSSETGSRLIFDCFVHCSESVMMKSGNIYILRYDTVRSILEKGMVELI